MMPLKLKRDDGSNIEKYFERNSKNKDEVVEISSESELSDISNANDESSKSLHTKEPNGPKRHVGAKGYKNTPQCPRSRSERDPPSGPHSAQRLIDLRAANPNFPISQVWRTLQEKGQRFTPNYKRDGYNGPRVALEGSTTSSCRLQDSPMPLPLPQPHKPNRLSRSRRIKTGRGEPDDVAETYFQAQRTSDIYRREPFSEDAVWTDKYRPVHSSEVIGNTAVVEHLLSWLKKWKRRATVEERAKCKDTLTKGQSDDCWDCGDFKDEVESGDGTEEQLRNAVLITGPPGVGKTASVYACALELGFKVFEVNCSSRRSGQEVLSHLKEATQSHLVEKSNRDALRPAFFNSCNTARSSDKLNFATGGKRNMHVGSRTKTLKKPTCSTSKLRPVQNRVCKKKANPVTLRSYFKTKAKADNVHFSSTPTERSSEKCTGRAVGADQTRTPCKEMVTCLILFEEVDVVFKSDVGFLAAVRNLLMTTKRPVALTTTDPLFRDRFNYSLEEIVFQTPSMPDVCSFLQLVCLTEDVQLDLHDVTALFKATRGDVRRCLLQLQFWASSGGGLPSANEWELSHKGDSSNRLSVQSVTQPDLQPCFHKQRMSELLQPVVECCRGGYPTVYSNLELYLQVDAIEDPVLEADKSTLMPPCDSQHMDTTFSQKPTRSRLSRKKTVSSLSTSSVNTTSLSKTAAPSKAQRSASSLGTLADFFDLMSFVDASFPLVRKAVAPCCERGDFGTTGAKILDGLLDEMREEEDEGKEMVFSVRDALEALGSSWCKRSSQKEAALTDTKSFCHTCHLCPNIVHQRRLDLNKKVLWSPYFSLLHDTRAVCVDYLPVVRFVCRTHRERQRRRTKQQIWSIKTFRTQLGLAKESVHLLGCEFS